MKKKKLYLSDQRRMGEKGREFTLEGTVNFLPPVNCGEKISQANVVAFLADPDYEVHIFAPPLYLVNIPARPGREMTS